MKMLLINLPQVRRHCWIQSRCSSAPHKGPLHTAGRLQTVQSARVAAHLATGEALGKKAPQELQSFTSAGHSCEIDCQNVGRANRVLYHTTWSLLSAM